MTSENTSALRRVWSQADLQEAQEHVHIAEDAIATQRRKIETIKESTPEADQARKVVATMERMRRELIRHRDRIAELVHA